MVTANQHKFDRAMYAAAVEKAELPRDAYDVRESVPVLDEHERDGDVYTKEELEDIANNMNYRIARTGGLTPIVLRHTSDHPEGDPPVVGYAGPYYVDEYGDFDKSYAIYARKWYTFKSDRDVIKRYGRRSVEMWLHPDISKRVFDPIALLGAETPYRELGVNYSAKRRYKGSRDAGIKIATYAMPAANNTYIPSHEGEVKKGRRKRHKNYEAAKELVPDLDEIIEHSIVDMILESQDYERTPEEAKAIMARITGQKQKPQVQKPPADAPDPRKAKPSGEYGWSGDVAKTKKEPGIISRAASRVSDAALGALDRLDSAIGGKPKSISQEINKPKPKANQETPKTGYEKQPSDDISPKKAAKILADGEVNGKPLTDDQIAMFQAAKHADEYTANAAQVDADREGQEMSEALTQEDTDMAGIASIDELMAALEEWDVAKWARRQMAAESNIEEEESLGDELGLEEEAPGEELIEEEPIAEETPAEPPMAAEEVPGEPGVVPGEEEEEVAAYAARCNNAKATVEEYMVGDDFSGAAEAMMGESSAVQAYVRKKFLHNGNAKQKSFYRKVVTHMSGNTVQRNGSDLQHLRVAYRKQNSELQQMKARYKAQGDRLARLERAARDADRRTELTALEGEGFELDIEEELKDTAEYSADAFDKHVSKIRAKYRRLPLGEAPVRDMGEHSSRMRPDTNGKAATQDQCKRAEKLTLEYRQKGEKKAYHAVLAEVMESDAKGKAAATN